MRPALSQLPKWRRWREQNANQNFGRVQHTGQQTMWNNTQQSSSTSTEISYCRGNVLGEPFSWWRSGKKRRMTQLLKITKGLRLRGPNSRLQNRQTQKTTTTTKTKNKPSPFLDSTAAWGINTAQHQETPPNIKTKPLEILKRKQDRLK